MYCSKMAEPTEMPFGVKLTHAGPWNHVLNGVQIPKEKGHCLGAVQPTEKHWKSVLQCMQQKINNCISVTAAADCIAPN